MRFSVFVACVVVASALTSCSSDDRGSAPKAQPAATPTPPRFASPTRTARPCEHLRPATTSVELHGQGDASLYGLILSPFPIRTGDTVKIVWRMTGAGSIHLRAFSPQGRAAPLAWGPEYHGGSSYQRPGAEWGAGYKFSTPGCWRLHAQRDDGEADAFLYVA